MRADLIGWIVMIQKKRQFLRDNFVSEKILIGGFDFIVGAIPLWLPLLGQARGPAPTGTDVRTEP